MRMGAAPRSRCVGLAFIVGSALIAAAGCSSTSHSGANATVQPSGRAMLVGYRTVSAFRGTSGPVSSALSGSRTLAVREALTRLTPARPVICHADPGLIYELNLPPSRTGASPILVAGYRCGAEVSTQQHGKTAWFVDRGCRLSNLVKSYAPAAATATRTESVGCLGDSGER
jgi:hypothetical protein